MKDFKERLNSAELDADKLELLEYLLAEEGLADASHEQAIKRQESRAALPLSFAQQRLWFLNQLQPGNVAYNMPGQMRLSGTLNVEALRRSIDEIVRRHESLRTTFTTLAGEPVQTVAPHADFDLPVLDLSELNGVRREEELRHIAGEEAQRPFDLTTELLLRARLLRLDRREHVLLITMHHIASDGWSIGIFVHELATLYEAFVAGQPSPLAELAIQYADYAVWQREWLQGEVLAEQIAYWRGQLADPPPALELPTDRPRPARQTFRAATRSIALERSISDALKTLALSEDATLFMTLLAAFHILLSRYSGQTDILIGTPVANRHHAGTENLIGFFVNTLVMRGDLGGRPGFREFLRRVREMAVGAYAHQDVPFEKLVEALQPERDSNRAPLFQVTFALQNASTPEIDVDAMRWRVTEANSGMAKFDLTLELAETPGGLAGVLQYNTDVFDAATIERMAEHFRQLLESIAANPDQPVYRLSLLTQQEAQRMLVEWNATAGDYPRDACLHQLFEAQAARTPDAVAVIFEDERLSYAELNHRANRVAHYLVGLGVRPEMCVGVLMERSPEAVVALLGIMKAGGAYVPLDAAYPPERLAFMIEDAGVRIVLAQQRLLGSLPSGGVEEVLCLDSDWAKVAGESEQNPATRVCARNMIYIIYTSGSTGRPKGVVVAHRGVVNCLLWLQSEFHIGAQERVMLKASLSFDASVWELFWPLVAGAGAVVARPGGQHDSAYLVRTITRHGVTDVNFVPSMLPLFLDEEGLGAARSLRRIFVGGEAMPLDTLHYFFTHSTAELHNFYGPTEASIGSIDWRGEPGKARAVVPIGRPISNTHIYILDPDWQPVPVGVQGELYIGGDGLTRGYLKRPELTAERFIPHPFSAEAGGRLYRTGDLARYQPGGTIEFLGRLDHQVKIRGYRIELGEIEAVLREHDDVRECHLMAREDAGGDKRLVAYLVAARPEPPATADLRRYLKERLPEHMIPSAFVLLEEFPLTSSGKVNRRALPAPEEIEAEASGGYVAPRTAVEEVLVSILVDVLKTQRVGVYDNFFELGGHSLLATQVVARVREVLQVELPLNRFFECPAVADLAALVEAGMRAGHRVSAPPPLRPVSRDGGLPLSFAQQRLWFIDQLEPGSPVYNMAGAVRLTGALDTPALERALNEVRRRHEALRTTFENVRGEPVQVVGSAHGLEVDVVDLTGLTGAVRESEVERLSTLEAQRPFNLATGPLLRAQLLRLEEEEHVLLMTMHHIVSDGWSMGVFVREIAALYEAYAQGQSSPLGELAIQYADYAVWQREWLQGEVLAEQMRYWREQLAGAPPVLELPTDRPRPKVQSFRGAALAVELPQSLTEALKDLSRREGVTLYMTLLAVWQTLLARYSGQTDISIGTPIANRRRAEMERLIGFFVNTLVLRTDLSGDPTFQELLKRVREVCIEGYGHQDVPFEMLVEAMQPERNLSHSPLFQVLLVLQNAPRAELNLPGLKLTPMLTQSGTAKFDLMMFLEETADGLSGVFEYSTDLFDEATIRRLLRHFQTLLQGIVTNSALPISSLPLLDEAEKRQLLVEWNSTAAAFPHERCVHELVEQEAARNPDEWAVVFGDERVSYRELNARANRLAHYLRGFGVGAETVIGIMSERSSEMMIGVLGILKAGGAYLPLDPASPRERLSFMLEDAGALALLTQETLTARIVPVRARVIRLDADADAIARESDENPKSSATADNAAYVIYTSGSTGKPKAVVMSHRAAVNLITFQRRSSGAAGRPRTLQFAPLSFDVSFQETFATWAAGATLVLADESARRDAGELLKVLAAHKVERLFLPFVALQHLAEAVADGAAAPGDVRAVITAGEQLKITPQVAHLFAQFDACTLDNHYGPTETHLATMWRLEGAASVWPALPPIGRPIANAQVYVLDERLQPVPVGVAGELYIGGEGLARGYLNRPGQTAERFIPHPFAEEAGARLYRTGDLARYLYDGRLEYVGRVDNQVKIRGFRIEVGEVEAVLKQHAAVTQAAVTAREDEAGRKRLIAYIVARRDSSMSSSELRQYLKEQLPEYMIPAVFVPLDALPLTPSGKVDRGALPAPEGIHTGLPDSYDAPRTPVEEALASIWAEVLKVERVGIHNNFFDSGGHSLLATQLISRLRDVFQVELPVRRLFEQPTVEELARSIEERLRGGENLTTPPVLPVSRAEPLPLSFAQQRLWFLHQLEPDSASYNLPAAVRIDGSLNRAALLRSITEIVRRHEVLRTIVTTVNGQPVQRMATEARVSLPFVDLREFSAQERREEVRRHMHEETQAPFKLSEGGLLRGRLLRLEEEEHVLLMTMHHIVSDGWSMGVFVREIAALYGAYAQGQSSPLGELAIQYADYAVWQREWLQGEVLAEQMRYWREQLAGAPPVLELPTDRPRPAVKTLHGATQRLELPAPLRDRLVGLSRREGVTLYMTLLAAWQTLLARYSGQTDISIGTPIANRRRAETERLIGFFVNTLVLRTDLSGDPTFRELLKRVREVCIEGYGHQDVPFEMLVEAMQPERNLSHSPLFQVAFALQNTPMPDIELGNLQLTSLDISNETAKFDLTLSMAETTQGLTGMVEYNTDLFESATIEGLLRHFRRLLEEIIADPNSAISAFPLLTDEERRQLLVGWNDTAQDYPRSRCMHHLFEEQAARTPDGVALVFENERLSYGELNRRANQLAHHLRGLGIAPEKRVGVLMERSTEMVVGVLGIVKAGGAYVPLDPAWPVQRLHFILSSLEISCLLTQSAQLRVVHHLEWQLEHLSHVLCLDVESPAPPAESFSQESVRDFWNHIAERAVDERTAGGFISSYTGAPFDETEVAEYRNHVVSLAQRFAGRDSRVLEIGCGAGLIMFEMAAHAGRYVGLDPSPLTQARNASTVTERGLDNIELLTGFAHEIDGLKADSFDLVIIASTAQFFPGAVYFVQVVEKILRLLRPGGTLLVADLLDARRKEAFRASLLDYQREHPDAHTKTALDAELYFDEDFFSDLQSALPHLGGVEVLHREHGFANELGYRYDVLLHKTADPAVTPVAAPRKKNLQTLWHLRGLPEHNPSGAVAADNLAYIIFTSGSTGQPKGVMVRHRSAVNVIDWVNKTFGVGTHDRLLFVTSLTFDLSVYDIFGTLAAGASIHIATRADLRDPHRLVRLLCEEPITFWDSAPATLQQLAPFFPPPSTADAGRLRLVFLSGDWIPLKLPDEVRATFTGASVVSLGGATEATVWSNFFRVEQIEKHWASIPYGKPIRNVQYHVLDARLEPCPVGVPGDLYIGGACLSDGYTDAGLTAQKFIPNPFGTDAGARLYATGDRARYRHDGNLEFLGRRDNQVKLRGFRIELGEIEAVLSEHPSARDVAVAVRAEKGSERRLVGYVVPKASPAPTTVELRNYLRERLPEYMVPSAFVLLERLPSTVNGKLDREALPAPDTSRPALEAAYVAPQTALEQTIGVVWQQVLDIAEVGVDDNFFDLGGHSLLMVQAHSKLRELAGVDLSIIDMFRYPTIRTLAGFLGKRQPTAATATGSRQRAAARRDAIRERPRSKP